MSRRGGYYRRFFGSMFATMVAGMFVIALTDNPLLVGLTGIIGYIGYRIGERSEK